MEALPVAPSLTQILEARRILRRVLPPTLLRTFPTLNRRLGGQVWLKLEAWQPTGSFKVRGALAWMAQRTPEERARGVVTASAGNHGLAVAFAAQVYGGIPATVFVPETAAPNKIRALEAWGVRCERKGRSYSEAHAAAMAFAASTGACYIHAYEDPWVVAGQGTIALGLLEELPEAEAVLVPVGGGGLIGGIALVFRALAPTSGSSACRLRPPQPWPLRCGTGGSMRITRLAPPWQTAWRGAWGPWPRIPTAGPGGR